jgi:hypothetical protein
LAQSGIPPSALRGCCAGIEQYKLRVLFFLEQDGHEPVLHAQLAPEGLAPERVRFEGALTREHRLADALAAQEFLIKLRNEAPRRFHQHGMAHRRDGTYAAFKPPPSHRSGGIGLGLRGLAGVEEEERNAMIAHDVPDLVGVDLLWARASSFSTSAGSSNHSFPRP